MGLLLLIVGFSWAGFGVYMLADQPWMALADALSNSTFSDPMQDPAVITASHNIPFVAEPILIMILPGLVIAGLGSLVRRQRAPRAQSEPPAR